MVRSATSQVRALSFLNTTIEPTIEPLLHLTGLGGLSTSILLPRRDRLPTTPPLRIPQCTVIMGIRINMA